MKSKLSSLIIAAVLGLSGAAFSANALADEGKLVGPITKITMAADGKSATAVLKDNKGGTNGWVKDSKAVGICVSVEGKARPGLEGKVKP